MTPSEELRRASPASRRCSRRCPTSSSSTAAPSSSSTAGAAMRDEQLREAFATDIVLLKYVGLNPVIVHGGGPDITTYMERLGMEVRFHEGPARVGSGDGRGGEDGPARQGQLGHRQPDQPPRPAGRRPLGRGRLDVRGQAGCERRRGRQRRRDRPRRRRRPEPHRRGLHPGRRVRGRRHGGQLLQRERGRRGGQGRGRAACAQGDLPHRRPRLARGPGRRRDLDLARDRRRGRAGAGATSRAACGRS